MSYDTQLRPNHRNFNGAHFPNFAKPYMVGHFSIDKDRKYISDSSNCKYLHLPQKNKPVQLDLNKGYENVIHKLEERDEKIDHLLTFIINNIHLLKNNNECTNNAQFLKTNVVCFRGLLRLLMCTPYEFINGWIILATKFRGTIYLCAQETDEAISKRLNTSDQVKKICSYGFKFEQYVLTGW